MHTSYAPLNGVASTKRVNSALVAEAKANTVFPYVCVKGRNDGFNEELSTNDSSKAKIVPIVGNVTSWLADTGASVDAIDRKLLSQRGLKNVTKLAEPRSFETAAGAVTVKESVPLQSAAIGEIDAVLLKSSPAVITVGKRCMDLGYDFHWRPYQPPVITHPDGETKVTCVVRNYCPYVEEEGGVACPFTATEGTSSSSSSCRAPARDDGQNQPVRENPDETEGVASSTPSIQDTTTTSNLDVVSNRKVLDKDNIPLMELEAKSVYHMLTHTPKNPYCPACQRAKLQRTPHKHRKVPLAERVEATEFGDLITGDHIVTIDELDRSIDHKRDALVMYDVATGYLDVFPTSSKSANETISALQHFIGPKQAIGMFHADAAKEITSAAKALGLCHDPATPGRPQSNGLAESKVRKVLEGTRTILDHAGMDSCYWSYASKHFCFCHNHTKAVVKGVERQEPIKGRNLPEGSTYPELIPFGCLVDFLPSPIFLRKFPKWGTKAQPGIFLQYVTRPGGQWRGDYMVAMLADFQRGESRPQVHTIREVTVQKRDGEFVFPLKEMYEQRRNQVTVQVSDSNAKRSDFEETLDPRLSSPFDVPPMKNESETTDASKNSLDSDPKPLGENITDAKDTASSSTTTPEIKGGESQNNFPHLAGIPKTSVKQPYVGSTTACGVETRNYRGSKRPPDIPGVVWQTLSVKDRNTAYENFKRTGLGWPKEEPSTDVPKPTGTTATGHTSHSHSLVPAMPTISICVEKLEHRPKIPDVEQRFHTLCVARAVSKKEAATTPKALAAMDKEWDKLEKQKAWLIDQVREWRDVRSEAKAEDKTVHVGRVFGFLVEKGSELPPNHPDRKFKGRVVFQGNQVRDQTGDWALFEELSSAPATMEAGKAVDAYGCVEGHVSKPTAPQHIRRPYWAESQLGSVYQLNDGPNTGTASTKIQ